jgi:hypothetical protein
MRLADLRQNPGGFALGVGDGHEGGQRGLTLIAGEMVVAGAEFGEEVK